MKQKTVEPEKVAVADKSMEVIPIPHSKVTQFLFGRPPQPVPQTPEMNPEYTSNFFSRLLWSWISETTYRGYNRSLQYNDIFDMDEEHKMERYIETIKEKVAKNVENKSHSPHWRAIVSTLKKYLFWGTMLHIASNGASIGQTVVANRLITYIQQIYNGDNTVYGKAVGFAVAELCLMAISLFSMVHSNYQVEKLMETLRNVLNVYIYQKSMALSSYGKAQYTPSTITSLLTTDIARITMASRRLLYPLSGLFLIIAVIGLLIHYLGVNALVGIAVVISGLIVCGFASKYISKYRKNSLPYADARTGTIRDTISNMRTLKLYGWESSFVEKTKQTREKEEHHILIISRINQTLMVITDLIPYIAGLLTFTVMSLRGHDLDPAIIFPSLSLFNMISPLTQDFAQGVILLADSFECFRRIELFLSADEDRDSVDSFDGGDCAIRLDKATFKWLKELPQQTQLTFGQRVLAMLKLLHSSKYPVAGMEIPSTSCVSGFDNVSLDIKKGELVMIVGSIGSGKSNLLKAIVGQMARIEGKLMVDGQITQVLDNWCLNATIRENILFGKEFDQALYSSTLSSCEILHDLQLFESGDQTEVGEHGVTLSGGQKARLALSRGVYNAQDIILLDDVLSAVDSKVGKNIMENCILGTLAGKTRLMATHNPAHFRYADRIIFMKDGVPHMDTLENLEQDEDFRDFMEGRLASKEEEQSQDSASSRASQEAEEEPANIKNDKLMVEEMRSYGRVGMEVLVAYIKFTGNHPWLTCSFIFLLAAIVGGSSAMQSVFLNWWSADNFHKDRSFYIGIYAGIVACMGLSQIGMIVALSGVIFRATSNLHNAAVTNIYRAPLSFFDTNPIGRIINRFTNDLATLDTAWVFMITMILPIIAIGIANYVVMFVYIPWAILCLIPLFVTAGIVLSYYRYSSREINRLVSLYRGKLLSSITENIDGSSVVSGYGRKGFFDEKIYHYANKTNSGAIMNRASMYWFCIRLVLAFLPLNFVVVMLCVFHVFKVSPSVAGMLLSVIPSSGIVVLQVLVTLVEIEKQLNSVERLYEYASKLPQEAPHEIPENEPKNWPSDGAIKFDNVEMRYRDDLPLVLHGLDLNILPGEKIGVCGRTGAGKSSLLCCLFRLNEISSGEISIDGVDISTLGLRQLRSGLSIIPQEAVLFKGTVRSNLDPFGTYDDSDLLNALKRSGSSSNLDDVVDQGGANFSLGERQLLTLGRALVRRSKILALDEATANVDHKTDNAIQKVLATEFSHCTVICIAHRLQTIIGYDRIVVMDRGQVAEFGTPEDLYHQNGIFTSLCRESNIDLYEIQSASAFTKAN